MARSRSSYRPSWRPLHLHRLRLGRFSGGAAALSLCPDGARGRLRNERILPSVRTLVPALINALLAKEAEQNRHGEKDSWFNRQFEKFRDGYTAILDWSLQRRPAVFAVFLLLVSSGAVLLPFVGGTFSPP